MHRVPPFDLPRATRWTVVAVALAVAPAVHAAEPTAAEIAVARKLFGEASEHEKKKEWAEAEKKLLEAVEIKETPGLRYHLAYVQEQQGRLVEALVDYDRAAELIAHGEEAADVERLLTPARERLEQRVPRLTVTIDESVEDASLSIDGKVVAPALVGSEVPLNPSDHEIVVTAPGRRDYRAQLVLVEGDRKTLAAELPPSPAAPPAPRSSAPSTEETNEVMVAPSGSPARRAVLITEGAIALTGFAAGFSFVFKKKASKDEAKEARKSIDELAPVVPEGEADPCFDPTGDLAEQCRRLRDSIDDEDKFQRLSTIGFVVGGVAATAAFITVLLWSPSGEKERPLDRAAVRVDAAPMPGGFYTGVTTQF